ncbi:MAG: 4-alpha-glucanotransferase [Porphyromonadaceae bacterium CG2_30_38_12]|nr:MAG: 4-alpha-glucanotransferase [Porphyromonadaceae bacterium CG2_30_38_12]
MKIHFKIAYYTYWGQRLVICGNIPQLGNDNLSQALTLNFQGKEDWVGEIEIPKDGTSTFSYAYFLVNEHTGQTTQEWGSNRIFTLPTAATEHVFCFDVWNSPASLENTFLTAPFKNILLKDTHTVAKESSLTTYTHQFSVYAPTIPKNHVVCLIGNVGELGNWNVASPLLLQFKGGGGWEIKVNLKKADNEIHYKYGIYDVDTRNFCFFESGADRLAPHFNAKKTLTILNDGFIRLQQPAWRGVGVGIPVFSLRSKRSFGVGDFVDLKILIDWAQKTGIKLVQVLPLNDTIGTHTDADVLPYAAISAFALNPLFLNLPALGTLPEEDVLMQAYRSLQPTLNAEPLVPFMEVIDFKFKYANALYLAQKEEFLKDKNFKAFFKKNAFWLVPYAAYCVLRDKYHTPDYSQWGEFANFNQQIIDAFVEENQAHFDAVAVNYFIQYHLHLQLQAATTYAHENGVVLKGDIPIGVNRNSVDTWVSPELFLMDCQAGAPPDMFAVKGQNWELPTYNWDMIQRTDFDWWKKRFAQMSNYFDTFRIDHILGFFRIWQIPVSQVEGIMGYLYPSTPIHLNEFASNGIWFDYNRFCKPYITDQLLWDFFGDDAHWVKSNCLKIEDGWVLRLRSSYNNQSKVDALYAEGQFSRRIKWGLFDLISNVLFFEVEGSQGTQFYPRFGMQGLRTFQELDGYTQTKIDALYVDYFFRRQDAYWYQSGMEKLPALKRATNMLICGEDLGMMTPCVTSVMKELAILSLEVQRAPKSDKIEFFHPADAPYLSVVTPSTHDMSTIRAWWEEDRGITQRFYNSQLGHWGEAPYFCEWWICRDILLQHLHSPAMWTIFQMQDLLSISEAIRRENPHDERINVPSNSKYSWRYRMHINLEDLIENDTFNGELKNYIVQSGR